MPTTRSVAVNLIDPPTFNSRVATNPDEPTKVKELAESLKTDGQKQPINLEEKADGRYELVFGSRRLAAARLLGWSAIRAEVEPPTDERTRVLTNGIENVQRENLSTYELGRLCAKLRDLKFKGKEIAARLGLSESHISNVAVCYEMLPPEIKTHWQEGHPAADVSFLRTLVNKKVDGKVVGRTPAEMFTMWNERVASLAALDDDEVDQDDDEDEDDADDKDPKRKTAKAKTFTVSAALYKATLKALRTNKSPQVATDVARFLVGEIPKVRGLTVEVPE